MAHSAVAGFAANDAFQYPAMFVGLGAGWHIAVGGEFALGLLEDFLGNDGFVFTFVKNTVVLHFARIDGVFQQGVNTVLVVGVAFMYGSFPGNPFLGMPAEPIEFIDHRQQAATFKVESENGFDLFGLGFINDELTSGFRDAVTQHRPSARVLAALAGHGDLVAGAFGNQFPLELSER